MNTAAPAAARFARVHAGWLWVALVLHALGSAALQFGSDYVDMFETRLDWTLRMVILAALALGLIQLSALILRRVAGAEIAASMHRRMLLATLVLGVAGALSIASDRTSTILFGLLIGLAWRKWTRIPLLWILAAFVISMLGFELHRAVLKLMRELDLTMGYPVNRVVFAAQLGLIWSLLAGIAFTLLVTFAPAESWEVWREDITRRAELLPIPRLIPRVLLGLAVAGSLWVVYAQGRQNCRWLDRATGRSGCVGALALPSTFDTNLSFSQDGATLLATTGDDIAVYDFPGRRLDYSWSLERGPLVDSGVISADGSQIALVLNASGWDNTQVQIYRRGETAPYQTIAISETFAPELGFALDGRSLLVEDSAWDIASGAPLGPVDSDTRANYRTSASGFNDFSADGSLSVEESGAQLGIYRSRFDGTIGALIAPLPGLYDRVAIAFSADNSLLATAAQFDSKQVDLWRTSDGSQVKAFVLTPFENADVEALAFTPDGRYLLVARQFRDQIEIYQLP